MKQAALALILLMSFAAASCGGGGSGSDEQIASTIEGTWRGTLIRVSDGCRIERDLVEVHNIWVSGEEVTLRAADGRVLHGQVWSADSFGAETAEGEGFQTIDRVVYNGIMNGSAAVEITHSWSRPGGCSTVWQGWMHRDPR